MNMPIRACGVAITTRMNVPIRPYERAVTTVYTTGCTTIRSLLFSCVDTVLINQKPASGCVILSEQGWALFIIISSSCFVDWRASLAICRCCFHGGCCFHPSRTFISLPTVTCAWRHERDGRRSQTKFYWWSCGIPTCTNVCTCTNARELMTACTCDVAAYGEHHDVREAGCRPSLAAAATLHTQLRTIFCQLRYSCLSPRDLSPGEVKVTHTYK